MSISKEVIEAAQRAMMWKKLPFGGRDLEISLDANAAYAAAKLALTSAAPAIQAAAWDAVIARIDLGTPYMVDEKYVAGANWVRNQIEDVLKQTIEGKSE